MARDDGRKSHLIHRFAVPLQPMARKQPIGEGSKKHDEESTAAMNTNVFITDRCGLSPLGLVTPFPGSTTFPKGEG